MGCLIRNIGNVNCVVDINEEFPLISGGTIQSGHISGCFCSWRYFDCLQTGKNFASLRLSR